MGVNVARGARWNIVTNQRLSVSSGEKKRGSLDARSSTGTRRKRKRKKKNKKKKKKKNKKKKKKKNKKKKNEKQ